MDATPSIISLTGQSLANYVLNGGLLPLNNNEAFIRESTAVTVTLVDENDRAIACGAIAMYSPKQAYCVLGEIDDEYKNCSIWIEEIPSSRKETRMYRVTKMIPEILDRTAPTLFETVFADNDCKPTILHLVDALIDCSVGKANVDLGKNITIDLFEGNGSYLLGLADETEAIRTEAIDKNNLLSLLDYDSEMSIYDRTEHVTALINTPEVNGMLAMRSAQVSGYVLTCKNRILACYANDEEIFRQLISSAVKDMDSDECKMFVRFGALDVTQDIIEKATERKEVTRLHTRSNINGIKWSAIYCTNVGLHIF
ncbi:unnamed protein product [Nippostrongylus brasiliensis]|uniref:FIST_C domain-containing protein n=1 Tax=Nippostrongylus brasiliensis TaxID=27835 RepID=A0A0N4XW25_NIPBR|nr:unnamed protein product [Nippostrongylus brasiliensis]